MAASCELKIVEWAGICPYALVWRAMRDFTKSAVGTDAQELWILEHEPVYTLGQSQGQMEAQALLKTKAYSKNQISHDIPWVHSDRGGQVTYHGPGQLMFYTLWSLNALALNIRALIDGLEEAILSYLQGLNLGIQSHRIVDQPGVYLSLNPQECVKIASVGLRVQKYRCYHGLSFNLDLDLKPFDAIDPCGYPGLKMASLQQVVGAGRPVISKDNVVLGIVQSLLQVFNFNVSSWEKGVTGFANGQRI